MSYLRTLFCLLILSWTVACSTDGATSWTLFRGDAGLTGYADVRLPDRPALLWTYKSDERTSASPVVYHKTVYWCDKRGTIYGIDNEGRRTFDYRFQTAVEATPSILDSVLYIGRIDGFMSALSLVTKDTLWNFETQGQISAAPNSGVFAGRNSIVFGSYDNYLYCVDRVRGNEITRFESGYYINGAVAIYRNCFVFGGCDAWLRIVDGTNGMVSDSLELESYIPASPAIDGNYAFVADHSGNVYEIVFEDGTIDKSRKILTSNDLNEAFVSVPALSANTIFVLAGDRNLYAIDRVTGNIRWKYLQKGASGESSPVVCRDRVISCSKNGIVSLLDANDGHLIWEYDTGERITACPAVIDNQFYILTAKGTMFCFGEK